MCGRYTLRRVDLAHYGVRHPADLEQFEAFTERPRFNITPSQDVPVVRLDKEDQWVATLVRWGLIPSWTRGKPKTQPINARAETVATPGMFRGAFARRRCSCRPTGSTSGGRSTPRRSSRRSCASRTTGRSPSPGSGSGGVRRRTPSRWTRSRSSRRSRTR